MLTPTGGLSCHNKYLHQKTSSTEDTARMSDYFGTLGGRVTVAKLNETLGNLNEDELAMLAGWGLAIKRKEGWRQCSCVAATNSSMSARWLDEASPGEAASLAGEPVSEAVPGWCEVDCIAVSLFTNRVMAISIIFCEVQMHCKLLN